MHCVLFILFYSDFKVAESRPMGNMRFIFKYGSTIIIKFYEISSRDRTGEKQLNCAHIIFSFYTFKHKLFYYF